ncbi:MAG TPA: hypothetical protein VHY58_21450 [Streptosporangiaceae bacterium]|jgi:hypothetical protein|nr:hypothetical protein [Streptosporangiaceae bacterium]
MPPGNQGGPSELGAARCAELLSRRTGLRVRVGHVEALAEQGLLSVSRIYKQRPLYRVAEVEELAIDPLGRALVSDMVAGHELHMSGE